MAGRNEPATILKGLQFYIQQMHLGDLFSILKQCWTQERYAKAVAQSNLPKKKTWWFLLDMHENIMQIKALPTQRIHDLSGFTSENKLEHPVPAENHRRLIYETGLSVLFERL